MRGEEGESDERVRRVVGYGGEDREPFIDGGVRVVRTYDIGIRIERL